MNIIVLEVASKSTGRACRVEVELFGQSWQAWLLGADRFNSRPIAAAPNFESLLYMLANANL